MKVSAKRGFEFTINRARLDLQPSIGHVLLLDGSLISDDRVIELSLGRSGYPLAKADIYENREQQIFRVCVPCGVAGATSASDRHQILARATLSTGEQYTYSVEASNLEQHSTGYTHPLLEAEVFPAPIGTKFAQREVDELLTGIRDGISLREALDRLGLSGLSAEEIFGHIRSVRGRGDFDRLPGVGDQVMEAASIPSYYDLVSGRAPVSCSAQVCIVTSDLVGPTYNGGMGTFCTSLAETLAHAGADVHILFVPGTRVEKGTFDEWVGAYREKGITLLPLPFDSLPFKGNGLRSRSFEVFKWLSQRQFDVIHFHDMVGFGYYSTLAKQCGLSFEATRLCVEVHSPHRWHWHHDSRFFEAESELEMDFMERRSVECADMVLGPSAYLLNWVREQGWRLPAETYVLPYPLADHLYSMPHPRQDGRVEEIVFFGRLEKRKGLPFFCDVLDELHTQGQLTVPVSFLGKERSIDGLSSVEYIQLRASNWDVPVSVHTDMSHHDGLAYLREKPRLAVLASRSDNSPFTVYECIALGIPFIASDVGGIPELISADDKARTLFPLEVGVATQQLARGLKAPIRSVQPRYDPERVRAAWIDVHIDRDISNSRSIALPATERKYQKSDIEVIVDARGVLSQHLEEMLNSLKYVPEVSITLVRGEDDEELTGIYHANITETNKHSVVQAGTAQAAEAYNQVLGQSSRELLLFVDGKDVLHQDAIPTMLSAQQVSGCSMLSSMAEHFVKQSSIATSIELPLGPLSSVQCLRNVFGSSVFLAKRSFLIQLGGFCSAPTRNASVRELYSRAVLHSPDLCCLIPQPLVSVRYGYDFEVCDEFSSRMFGIKPVFEASQQWVRELVLLVQGLAIRVGENPNLEQHARPQLDWSPEKFHDSESLISLPKDNLAMHCMFEDCSATTVAEGMQIYIDGPVGFVYLPMTLIPRCTFIALSLHVEVDVDCEIFLEILRDGQHTFNTHDRLQIALHQGSNQVYKTFLANNLSGFFRLRFKKPQSPILLRNIEMRGID